MYATTCFKISFLHHHIHKLISVAIQKMRQKISCGPSKPHLGHDGALLRERTCDALRYIEEGGGYITVSLLWKKEYNLPGYAAIQKLWWKRIMLRGDNEAISFTGQHTKFSQGPLCLLLFTCPELLLSSDLACGWFTKIHSSYSSSSGW